MNFKPLENEEQYKNTRDIVCRFEKDIDDLLKVHESSYDFWFFAKGIIYTTYILEAEIQDCEHRQKGDYQFKKRGTLEETQG